MNEAYPEFDPSIAEEFGYGTSPSALDFLGVPLCDSQGLAHLLIRFAFNMIVCWIVIQFFYYRKSRRRDYYVTFMLFSATMFLLIFLMESVKLQIGLTLGLFAIFGVIRYRTETVPIREMTYLFVIIGISVINGLALTVSYAELLCSNLLFIFVIWLLESQKVLRHTATKLILYEKVELIVPERRAEMIADLERRTGLKIDKLEIGNIDFLRDSVFVKIYYTQTDDAPDTISSVTKLREEL